jgi:polyhydroxybutyrate depolymerase
VARTYFFTPPTNYQIATAYPLIIAFHGSGDNGANVRGYYGLEEPAKGQALFVYPSGNAADGGWSLANDGPDVKLVDAILKELLASYCVDTDAVFATGFSYGGWMATQIACARPMVIKGIAPVAGGGPQGSCSSATPAMIIHGSADGAEPIVAGENARNHYRDTNGCQSSSQPASPSPCVSLNGCKSPVLWCEHAGGHEIPTFARQGMWDFFESLH